MSHFVVDTRALHWHVAGSARLSSTAREILQAADHGLHHIFVPGIALVEMNYLEERGRLEREHVDYVFRLVGTIGGGFPIAGLERDTALALREVPRSIVADMPDRIITATARQLDLPLITREAAIRRSGVVSVVW